MDNKEEDVRLIFQPHEDGKKWLSLPSISEYIGIPYEIMQKRVEEKLEKLSISILRKSFSEIYYPPEDYPEIDRSSGFTDYHVTAEGFSLLIDPSMDPKKIDAVRDLFERDMTKATTH